MNEGTGGGQGCHSKKRARRKTINQFRGDRKKKGEMGREGRGQGQGEAERSRRRTGISSSSWVSWPRKCCQGVKRPWTPWSGSARAIWTARTVEMYSGFHSSSKERTALDLLLLGVEPDAPMKKLIKNRCGGRWRRSRWEGGGKRVKETEDEVQPPGGNKPRSG